MRMLDNHFLLGNFSLHFVCAAIPTSLGYEARMREDHLEREELLTCALQMTRACLCISGVRGLDFLK